MREVTLDDPRAVGSVCDTIRRGVVMVEMPSVFVLLAPPTSEGVAWLDRTKTRQPNKNYGTAIGSLEAFRRMAADESLPPELAGPGALEVLTGGFIRVTVAPAGLDTAMVRAGTHQGLLIDGPHRELFAAVESVLADSAEPSLTGGHRYTAPLCTSANHSGHPDGSILHWDRAREFGLDTGVDLVVRSDAPAGGRGGSYPIFWLRPDRISVEREGPGMDAIRAALPSRCFEA